MHEFRLGHILLTFYAFTKEARQIAKANLPWHIPAVQFGCWQQTEQWVKWYGWIQVWKYCVTLELVT